MTENMNNITNAEIRNAQINMYMYGYPRTLIWNNENYKTACVVF